MGNLSAADVSALQTQVVWGVFALAFVLGAIMQRSNFCTMGAISDIVNMGDWTRMRMWMMAVAVAILATQGMAALGWVDLGKSVYTSGKMLWLSSLVGGALFGLGMVLASGLRQQDPGAHWRRLPQEPGGVLSCWACSAT